MPPLLMYDFQAKQLHSIPGGLLTGHLIEPVIQPQGCSGRCRQEEVLKNFGQRGYKAEVRAQPDRGCSRENVEDLTWQRAIEAALMIA